MDLDEPLFIRNLDLEKVLSDNDFFIAPAVDEERHADEYDGTLPHMPINQWKLEFTKRINDGPGGVQIPEVPPPWLQGVSKHSPRPQLLTAAACSVGLTEGMLELVLADENDNEAEFLWNLATDVKPTDYGLETTVSVSERIFLDEPSVEMKYPPTGVPPSTLAPDKLGPQEGYRGPSKFKIWEMIATKGKKKEVMKFISAVSKSQRPKTLIINSHDVYEKFREFQFDIDDEWNCTLTDTTDVPVQQWEKEPGVSTDRASEMLESVGGEWADQAMIFMLRYGLRFNVDIEWALVIAPPLASAADYKAQLDKTLKDQEGRGVYTASCVPLNIPAYYSGTGAVTKK